MKGTSMSYRISKKWFRIRVQSAELFSSDKVL